MKNGFKQVLCFILCGILLFGASPININPSVNAASEVKNITVTSNDFLISVDNCATWSTSSAKGSVNDIAYFKVTGDRADKISRVYYSLDGYGQYDAEEIIKDGEKYYFIPLIKFSNCSIYCYAEFFNTNNNSSISEINITLTPPKANEPVPKDVATQDASGSIYAFLWDEKDATGDCNSIYLKESRKEKGELFIPSDILKNNTPYYLSVFYRENNNFIPSDIPIKINGKPVTPEHTYWERDLDARVFVFEFFTGNVPTYNVRAGEGTLVKKRVLGYNSATPWQKELRVSPFDYVEFTKDDMITPDAWDVTTNGVHKTIDGNNSSLTGISGNTVVSAKPIEFISDLIEFSFPQPIEGRHKDSTFTIKEDPRYTARLDIAKAVQSAMLDMGDSERYQNGIQYVYRFIFTAKPGYRFNTDATFSANGSEACALSIQEEGRVAKATIDCYSKTSNAICSIIYSAGEGTGNSWRTPGADGTEFGLAECKFTAPQGKYFAGWLVNGKWRLFPGEIGIIDGTTTVEAVWSSPENTEIRVTNADGTGTFQTITTRKNALCTAPSCTIAPPEEGYAFDRWEIVGTDKYVYPNGKFLVKEDTMTLAPIWRDTTGINPDGSNRMPKMKYDYTGPYVIENYGHLCWFAEEVKRNNKIDAILDTDLVITDAFNGIGTPAIPGSPYAAIPYCGVFDGNGHTIKIACEIVWSNYYGGIFGSLDGATIKNLTISGFINSSCSYIGGLAAMVTGSGNTKIRNCVSDVTINSDGSNISHNAGFIATYDTSNYTGTLTFENCSFSGTINGGFNSIRSAGFASDGKNITFRYCLYAGHMNLNNTTESSPYFVGHLNTIKFELCCGIQDNLPFEFGIYKHTEQEAQSGDLVDFYLANGCSDWIQLSNVPNSLPIPDFFSQSRSLGRKYAWKESNYKTQTSSKGDVTGSNRIDVNDYQAIVNCALDKNENLNYRDNGRLYAADLNDDGAVDVLDILIFEEFFDSDQVITTYDMCDYNRDGVVDKTDVDNVIRALESGRKLSLYEFQIFDLNMNGSIDYDDVNRARSKLSIM